MISLRQSEKLTSCASRQPLLLPSHLLRPSSPGALSACSLSSVPSCSARDTGPKSLPLLSSAVTVPAAATAASSGTGSPTVPNNRRAAAALGRQHSAAEGLEFRR